MPLTNFIWQLFIGRRLRFQDSVTLTLPADLQMLYVSSTLSLCLNQTYYCSSLTRFHRGLFIVGPLCPFEKPKYLQ